MYMYVTISYIFIYNISIVEQVRVTFTTYHIPSTNWLMDVIGLYRRKYAFSVLIASSLLQIDKIFE